MEKQTAKKEATAAEVKKRKIEFISFRRWRIFSNDMKKIQRDINEELRFLDSGCKIDEREEELLKALNQLLSQVQEIIDEGYKTYTEPHKSRTRLFHV